MKKSLRIKALVAACVALAFAVCLAIGCSPASSSSSSTNAQASSGDLAATYTVHADNAENGTGLAAFHTALGQDCESCHVGDLTAELAAMGIEGEPDCASTYYDDTATCLGSTCHVSWDALAERTADLGDYNPHDSIHGTITYCNECHKGHAAQKDICGECHPNGGQTMTTD